MAQTGDREDTWAVAARPAGGGAGTGQEGAWFVKPSSAAVGIPLTAFLGLPPPDMPTAESARRYALLSAEAEGRAASLREAIAEAVAGASGGGEAQEGDGGG